MMGRITSERLTLKGVPKSLRNFLSMLQVTSSVNVRSKGFSTVAEIWSELIYALVGSGTANRSRVKHVSTSCQLSSLHPFDSETRDRPCCRSTHKTNERMKEERKTKVLREDH